jgi:hypothetical protein
LSEIVFICVAFCLGVLVGTIVVLFLKNRLYSGTINVMKSDDKIIYSLELEHDPEELEHKQDVRFKVNKHPSVEGPSQ